jgi:hypothetical protein
LALGRKCLEEMKFDSFRFRAPGEKRLSFGFIQSKNLNLFVNFRRLRLQDDQPLANCILLAEPIRVRTRYYETIAGALTGMSSIETRLDIS